MRMQLVTEAVDSLSTREQSEHPAILRAAQDTLQEIYSSLQTLSFLGPREMSIGQELCQAARSLYGTCSSRRVKIPGPSILQERVSTKPDVLKRWYVEHAQYPYPTEEEKRSLSFQTNLNLRQISTWFINARRRSSNRAQSTSEHVSPEFDAYIQGLSRHL